MAFVLFDLFHYYSSLKALLYFIIKGVEVGYACGDLCSFQVLYWTLFVILAHIIMKYVQFN